MHCYGGRPAPYRSSSRPRLTQRPLPDTPEPHGPVEPQADPFLHLTILKKVARAHRVDVSDITGPSRKRYICHARWEAEYLMQLCGMSSTRIAKRLNRDHSSVLHGIREWKKLRGIKDESEWP